MPNAAEKARKSPVVISNGSPRLERALLQLNMT